MKKELDYALTKLENAFIKLKEGSRDANEELEMDGVIQRFEFTFELLWKTLKIFLLDSGVEAKSPKDSLKEGFKIGWLKDEQVFLNMLEDRNKTSHLYDKDTSEAILERIKNNYVPAIGAILSELKKRLK